MAPRIPTLVLAAAAITLNVTIGSVAHLLALPIGLDSVGIMLVAVLLQGSLWRAFLTAALVGFVSFFVGGLLINPLLPWLSLTALAGAAYGAFIVRGRIDDELSGKGGAYVSALKALALGVGWGIVAALVSAPVVIYFFGDVTGSGATLILGSQNRTHHHLLNAALLTGVAVEASDKALQMLIVLVVARATPKAVLERL
jgi:energy-coupling factor transport system substrate-specific component